jgi:hypothetical protein
MVKPGTRPSALYKLKLARANDVLPSRVSSFVKGHYKSIAWVGSLLISGSLTLRDMTRDRERRFSDELGSTNHFIDLREVVEFTDYRIGDTEVYSTDLLKTANENVSKVQSMTKSISDLEKIDQNASLAFNTRIGALEDEREEVDREIDSASILLATDHTDAGKNKGELIAIQALAKSTTLGHNAIFLKRDIQIALGNTGLHYQLAALLSELVSFLMIAAGIGLVLGAQLIGNPKEPPDLKL